MEKVFFFRIILNYSLIFLAAKSKNKFILCMSHHILATNNKITNFLRQTTIINFASFQNEIQIVCNLQYKNKYYSVKYYNKSTIRN